MGEWYTTLYAPCTPEREREKKKKRWGKKKQHSCPSSFESPAEPAHLGWEAGTGYDATRRGTAVAGAAAEVTAAAAVAHATTMRGTGGGTRGTGTGHLSGCAALLVRYRNTDHTERSQIGTVKKKKP